MGMKVPKRFTGLKLKARDLKELRRIKAGGKLSARTWRRILTLEHLHAGMGVNATAKAVGGYPREVSRVGKRYIATGLQAALSDNPRPGDQVDPPRARVALGDSMQRSGEVGAGSTLGGVRQPPTRLGLDGKRRFGDLPTLRRQVQAWRGVATHAGPSIHWRFRVADARRVFKYDALTFTRSEH